MPFHVLCQKEKPVIYKDCRLLDLPKNAICLWAFRLSSTNENLARSARVFNGARPFPKWSSLDEAGAFGYTNGCSSTLWFVAVASCWGGGVNLGYQMLTLPVESLQRIIGCAHEMKRVLRQLLGENTPNQSLLKCCSMN